MDVREATGTRRVMEPDATRVGVLYHPRVSASRRLAEDLARALGERGADTIVLDAWRGAQIESHVDDLDWVVALGGDGTMLRVARQTAPHGIPLLGVNFGRLGFLAELDPDDALYAVPRVLDGGATLEERIMLRCSMEAGGREVGPLDAVNDVFVGRGEVSRPVRLDTEIGGAPLARYFADGLVVATPTGSTAYSLSAGGPVVDPTMDALVLTPVVPHPVPARSIVLPGDESVQIVLRTDYGAILAVDGHNCCALDDGDLVRVTRCPYRATFIRIGSSGEFYASLMERLQRGKTTPRTREPID